MILKGKVKTGLGNASFWIKKIEEAFYRIESIRLFHGTLNIELEEEYELKNYWIISKDEYGGTQDVYIQECEVFGERSYIVRSEKTAHKFSIIEIVSNVNFREKYSLKDDDEVEIKIK